MAWYPEAERRPGARSGPSIPKSRMEVVKLHYTVGINSIPIGERGYFTFLIARSGKVYQFAEVQNVCWDSGEWNDAGPGIEFEYYPISDGGEENIVNPAMAASGAKLIAWLSATYGFPLVYHDQPRIPEGSWRGYISHRSLQQSVAHHDYITRAQWNSMTTAASVPIPDLSGLFNQEPSMPKQVQYNKTSHTFYVTPSGRLRHDWWTGRAWTHDYPAEIEVPSARFQVDQTLDVKVFPFSENPIDVYAIGKLGEFVHPFYTGKVWRTEVFA